MEDRAYEPTDRRPQASRGWKPIRGVASWLVRRRVSPNAISVTSGVFAAGAGLALAMTSRTEGVDQRFLWLAAAVLVPLRLLANLFDGMVAVESRTASPLGELYNEVPDRISDAVVLVGAGYAAGGWPTAGYLAALVAVFVAYVRAMGGLSGVDGLFLGPMAKPERMFLVAAVALFCALAPQGWQPVHAETGFGPMAGALLVVTAGGLLTAVRRLRRVASRLGGG